MKWTWHRVLFCRGQKQGTFSIFLDCDLRCWTFGVTFDPAPDWFDLKISLGPLGVSFMYWRRQVFVFD